MAKADQGGGPTSRVAMATIDGYANPATETFFLVLVLFISFFLVFSFLILTV
jgi:hypothetical protein